MAKDDRINRSATNERAIDRGCTKLRDVLLGSLKASPTMHGSVAVTVQISDGVIDRFQFGANETEKCEAIRF